MRAAVFPVLLLTALLVGCGGEDRGRPDSVPLEPDPLDPGSGPVDCSAGDDLELLVLEDFELGAAGGGWFTNNDKCERCQGFIDRRVELDGVLAEDPDNERARAERDAAIAALERCRPACEASQFPSIFDKPLPATRIQSGGRCGGEYALRVRTERLIDWGGTTGAQLVPPLDASEWDGFAFWARVGPDSRVTVRFELSEQHTDLKYRDADGGTFCNPDFTDDTLREGCDRFGRFVIIGADWQLFTVPFSEVRQQGWGKRAPFLDVWALLSAGFFYDRGEWDLWIDDLALYRRRTP